MWFLSSSLAHDRLIDEPTRQDNSLLGLIAFKKAPAALFITVSPQLESLPPYHIGESDVYIEDFPLLTLLQRANKNPTSISYMQNLWQAIFLPVEDTAENDGHCYFWEYYYHRLNLVRRLPALEYVSFNVSRAE